MFEKSFCEQKTKGNRSEEANKPQIFLHAPHGRSSGSYPNSGFSDSVSGFCKLFLKLKKSNGFSDSRILLHFLKAYYLVGFSDSAYFILNGFSDSVSGFSDSTDSRILNGFSVRILSSTDSRILRSICGFSEVFADSRILNGFSLADSQNYYSNLIFHVYM